MLSTSLCMTFLLLAVWIALKITGINQQQLAQNTATFLSESKRKKIDGSEKLVC